MRDALLLSLLRAASASASFLFPTDRVPACGRRALQHVVHPRHRMISISALHLVGISAKSLAFSSGMMTVLMPPAQRRKQLLLEPPIGSTRPRSVISPVIATSLRTGMPVMTEIMAVDHGDAGRRSILRCGAFRHMHVDVLASRTAAGWMPKSVVANARRKLPLRSIPSSRRAGCR